MKFRIEKKGLAVLEAVIAISIITVSLFSLVAISSFSCRLIDRSVKNIHSAFLLEEGVF